MLNRLVLCFVLSMSIFLTACTSASIGSSVGAVSGLASATVTANPVVGYAIGIGMQAATTAAIKYVMRTLTYEQQQLMAAIAGELPVGQTHTWAVDRIIQYGNERGQLQVVREIDNALTHCREVMFTVEAEQEVVAAYITAICKQQEQWVWATVDPSVQRWWGLQ